MVIKKIISEMPLEDKIAFCTGADFWHTKELPQHGVPSVMMSDGRMACAVKKARQI